MNLERLGRLARMLRLRRRMTQSMLADRAGVTRQAVSLLELGRADELRLRHVVTISDALGGRLDVRLLWNGPELDRLLDARHAAIGSTLRRRLEKWGWLTRVEVSFNHYGERGRIDLLAYHPARRVLVVVEIKTLLVDVQALLGSLDVKARVGATVVARFGWPVAAVVPAIVFAEDRTTRQRLVTLAPLFSLFALRGRAAVTWLRRPDGVPTGLLWLVAPAGEAAGAGVVSRVRYRAPTRKLHRG